MARLIIGSKCSTNLAHFWDLSEAGLELGPDLCPLGIVDAVRRGRLVPQVPLHERKPRYEPLRELVHDHASERRVCTDG